MARINGLKPQNQPDGLIGLGPSPACRIITSSCSLESKSPCLAGLSCHHPTRVGQKTTPEFTRFDRPLHSTALRCLSYPALPNVLPTLPYRFHPFGRSVRGASQPVQGRQRRNRPRRNKAPQQSQPTGLTKFSTLRLPAGICYRRGPLIIFLFPPFLLRPPFP